MLSKILGVKEAINVMAMETIVDLCSTIKFVEDEVKNPLLNHYKTRSYPLKSGGKLIIYYE